MNKNIGKNSQRFSNHRLENLKSFSPKNLSFYHQISRNADKHWGFVR